MNTDQNDRVTGSDDSRPYGDDGNDAVIVVVRGAASGGNGNDLIKTSGTNTYLRVDAGDDILWSDGGGSTLEGGTAADRMHGNTGDGWFLVDNAGDVIWAGSGIDLVESSLRKSRPPADCENLKLSYHAETVIGLHRRTTSFWADRCE